MSAGLAFAQQRPDLAFHFEDPPSDLRDHVARFEKQLREGALDDALTLAERIESDPRAHEGLVDMGARRFVTLDRVVRERLRALDAEGRRAFDARHESELDRLEAPGTLASLERLLAFAPGSSRFARDSLRAAELALEQGDIELAAVRFEDALAVPGLDPAAIERARIGLPALYALEGRRRECAAALAGLEGDTETAARRLAARAAEANVARRAELAAVTTRLASARWVSRVPDYYDDVRGPQGAHVEPVCDATCVYAQDGSRVVAVRLDTGALLWRTPLREDGLYRPAYARCRLSLSSRFVAGTVPAGDSFVLDRASGERLATVTREQLRATLGAGEATLVVESLLAEDVLVVSVMAHETTQELWLLGYDARTGTLLWRTDLGHAPMDASGYPTPAVLSRGAGLVFFLPGWGVLAGIEPQTGAVAWLREYDSVRTVAQPIPVRRGRHATMGVNSRPLRPGFLAIERGLLVVAPPDAPHLFAVEPRTGERKWVTMDDASRVLAGYGEGVVSVDHAGTVSLVAHRREPVAVIPPQAERGRSVVVGDVLLVACTSRGTIYRIDLAKRGLDRNPPWFISPVGPANLAASSARIIAAGEGTIALLGSASVAPVLSVDAANAGRLLGDPSFAVREAAQHVLAGLDDDAEAALTEAAAGSDIERAVRARGLLDALHARQRHARFVNAIRRSGSPRLVGYADRLVAKDSSIRANALDALRRSNDASFRPIFEELLQDPDLGVARTAAYAALTYGSRSGVPILAKMAASPIAGERVLALALFSQKGSADDFEVFAKALQDDDQQVRRYGLDGALRLGDGRMVAGLKKALETGVPIDRGRVLDDAASRRLAPELAGPILGVLAREPDQHVRRAAVGALLYNARTLADRAPLVAALDDKDPEVARAAHAVLRQVIEHEDPPSLQPGALEELMLGPERENHLDTLLVNARSMLRHGKLVRVAVLAALAARETRATRRGELLAAIGESVKLGPLDAKDALALEKLLRDERRSTRRAASEAVLHASGAPAEKLLALAVVEPSARMVREVTLLAARRAGSH